MPAGCVSKTSVQCLWTDTTARAAQARTRAAPGRRRPATSLGAALEERPGARAPRCGRCSRARRAA
eukprot:4635326-Alexandrium_andersonii.AAC.1